MNLLRFFTRPRPITASEIGRKGAKAKHELDRAPIRAKAQQMRRDLGLGAHPALGRP